MQKFYSFLLLLLSINCSAQISFFKQYTVNDGLPSTVIFDLAQDSIGYLWIATNYGLSKFDGYNFTNYTTATGNVLTDNSIIQIFEGKDNKLWFLSFTGKLSYLKENQLFTYNLIDPIIQNNKQFDIKGIRIDKYDRIWINYCNGRKVLCVLPDHRIIKYDTLLYDPKIIEQVYRDFSPGKNEKPNLNSIGNQVGFSNNKIQEILSKNPVVYQCQHTFWMMKPDKNLIAVDSSVIHCVPGVQIDSCNIFIEKDKKLWLREYGAGIYLYDCKMNDYKPQKFFLNKKVTRILKDRENNYWVSTEGDGLYLVPTFNFHLLNNNPKLPDENIISLDIKGNLMYFSSNDGRIYKATINAGGKVVDFFEVISTETNKYCRSILIHSDGSIWVATTKYLRYNKNGEPEPLKLRVLKKDYDLMELEGGVVLVATREGFQKYNNQGLIYDSRTDGFFEHIRSIFTDDNGNIWLGTMEGLYKYNNNDYIYYGEKHSGLTSRINDINEVDGKLWVGTRINGVYILDGDSIFSLSIQQGLSSNIISKIFVENDSVVWVGTNQGLNKIEINSNKTIAYKITRITIWDGLPSNEINDIGKYRDFLIVATNRGLCSFNPSELVNHDFAPLLHINKIKVNDIDTCLIENMVLDSKTKSIYINYVGIGFNNPGKIIYKYKIERQNLGFSLLTPKNLTGNDWIETNNTSIRFGLVPGKYTFYLNAANSKGTWNNEPVKWHFEVRKPFTQKLWFFICMIILFIVLILFVFHLILRGIKLKAKRQQELLLSKQKALRAQMNPHFMFNSLNSIQHLILEKDEAVADIYLARFSSLMRKVLENSKYDHISLKDEIETLRLYLELEKLRFEEKFDFEISVDDEVEPEYIKVPPMLIQPYLENAIWHGLMPKGTKGLLKLTMTISGKFTLHCVIEDNGIGREKSAAFRKHKKNHQSTGMKNIEERIILINELYNTKMNIIITDLYDENKNPTGTRVEVFIPFEIDE